MRWPKTLRVRFSLWVAGLLLVAFSMFGSIVYFSMARGLLAAVDSGLHATASRIILNARDDEENVNVAGLDKYGEELDDADLRESQFTIRILDLDGDLIGQVGSPFEFVALANQVIAAKQGLETFTTLNIPNDSGQVRVYLAPIVENDQVIGLIQVIRSLAEVRNTLNRLLIILLVSVPLVVALASWAGYFLAARALAPVDQITRTARRISVEDLSARLNLPATYDEVGRLAVTFDSMLTRLDDAFRRERQFIADASHELRTPLTAMQTILSSTLIRQRAPAEYEQALVDLTEETDRMQTLTEGLLLLARADVPHRSAYEMVDLSTLLEDVTDSLRPLAEDKGLTLSCNLPANLSLHGDHDGLIRLFVNLLGNAIKYTEQGQITVSAGQDQTGTVCVTVIDTGVGIAPGDLSYIFDRFYRVDNSRTGEGVGLGLAIASEIAQAHAGSIEVKSEIGQGTMFTVTLATA